MDRVFRIIVFSLQTDFGRVKIISNTEIWTNLFNMKFKKSFSRVTIIIISIFMLVVTGVLGTVLIIQSRNDLRKEMRGRMLDILNSAAYLLDGDVLERLQKEDVDTPEYQYSLNILRAFQDNFKLAYIYGIRDMGDKRFTFTIDPAVEDPGEFGEPIVYTDALYSASRGVAAVDDIPYEDKWGRFYSAYVPVFNSKGKVGGIIAVDVDATWYEQRLRKHIFTTLIICIISLIAGGIIVFLIFERIQKRLSYINLEMGQLTDEVEELAQALKIASGRRTDTFEYDESYSAYDEEDSQSGINDEFEELCERLKYVRSELQQYIDDAHELAYTDALTGAANRNAYIENVKLYDDEIRESEPEFSIAVFDINGLKNANDTYGHEYGDLLIITASDILKDFVGSENLFRIGGDEFVAILEVSKQEKLDEIFAAIDSSVAEANENVEDFKTKAPLAISKGVSTYVQGKDSSVQVVFHRADEAMYADKTAYYKKHDRRR